MMMGNALKSRSPWVAAAAVVMMGAIGGGRSAEAATLPFFATFDGDATGSQAGFAVYSGNTASSTAFVVSNPTGTSGVFNNTNGLNIATSATMQFTNVGTAPGTAFVEKVTATPTNAGAGLGNDFFGLGALGTGPNLTNADPVTANNTAYLADLNGSNAVRIIKLVNGATTATLATGTFPVTPTLNTAYTLTLTGTYNATGGLTLSFNVTDGTSAVTIANATPDTTPLTGQYFGPRNRNSATAGTSATATVDNFSLVVPEPAGLGLIGMAAAGLLGRRRRRHN